MMKRKSVSRAVVITGMLLFVIACQSAESAEAGRLIVWDGDNLSAVKQRIQEGDEFFNKALAALRKEGEIALKAGPFSVMSKTDTPPSGDKHDYMSVAPYWWPNPDMPDGLPYIHRDGLRNPAYLDGRRDRRQLGGMCDAIEVLSLCYYFTDEAKYAQRAALLLRTWFLDEATRMNPNLNFGQAVPGQSSGRCYGIIETSHMIAVVDCALILKDSVSWTEKDDSGLRDWFREYVQWLTTNGLGLEESRARNNHSTWYDAQTAAFAMYAGDRALAERILRESAAKHIDAKIEPDGKQPRELTRTKAFGYSTMNLRGTFVLARLAEHFGMDLWNYQTEDGRSLEKALAFLIPYADLKNKWPYQQISPLDAAALYPLLKQADVKIRGFDGEPSLKRLREDEIVLQKDILLYP